MFFARSFRNLKQKILLLCLHHEPLCNFFFLCCFVVACPKLWPSLHFFGPGTWPVSSFWAAGLTQYPSKVADKGTWQLERWKQTFSSSLFHNQKPGQGQTAARSDYQPACVRLCSNPPPPRTDRQPQQQHTKEVSKCRTFHFFV